MVINSKTKFSTISFSKSLELFKKKLKKKQLSIDCKPKQKNIY